MAKKAVFGILNTEEQAISVVQDLKAAGFSSNDISPAAGATAGGLLGGALGWLAGIGTLAIPGVGPFIAAGPIMGLLSGAAVGAATGGLTGALVGYGMPEMEAKRYEGKVRGGNILLSIHTEDRNEVSRAKEVLKLNHAQDVTYTGEAGVSHEAHA